MDHFYYQKILIKLFLESVAAVNPAKLITENLKIEKKKLHICHKVYDVSDKNIYVIGFGKAVLGMAAQCEKILGKYLKSGVICSPQSSNYSFTNDSDFNLKKDSVIKVYKGAENNVPDENAQRGTNEIISLVEMLDSSKDHLIVLISGGGSALFTKPKPGILLSEKRKTIKLLMESGADIKELNTVRKKLSVVKGGGLARLSYPVLTSCLIISDVINDPMDIIASGPTVPPNSDLTAFNIIRKFNLEDEVPESVLLETKKPIEKVDVPIVDSKFLHVNNFIIGNNNKALTASKKCAEESGFQTVLLSNQIKGIVQNVSEFYTNIMYQILIALHQEGQVKIKEDDLIKEWGCGIDNNVLETINKILITNAKKNICIIAGGEPTVEVKGNGKGGRNQELALLTSIKLGNLKKKYPHLFIKYEVILLFAGTDGQDGPTDAAGAMADSTILEKCEKNNLDIHEFLLRNDSYSFFNKIDNGSFLIKTGHTGTNVMDIHIMLVHEK